MLGDITIYRDNQRYLVPTIYVYFVRKQYIALRNCISELSIVSTFFHAHMHMQRHLMSEA